MTRRTIGLFITLALALLVAPLAAEAPRGGKVYRVGFLWDSPTVWPSAIEAFYRGLHDLGWVEGQNLVVERRWAEGRFDRLPDLAEDLVHRKVDVIVAPTSIYAAAAKRATSTIPIVFAVHADPIGSGYVASLARPGGNLTGLSLLMTETNAKGLELLKEALPGLSRVASSGTPPRRHMAPALDLRVDSVAVRSAAEFEGAFEAMSRDGTGGVLVLSTPLFIGEAKRLAELALQHQLPTMFGPRAHAEAGGLLSYGPDRADLFRRAALYVDKILNVAKPADLPVEQPTKFELVINLKTAQALGLTISRTLLFQATDVIR